MVTSLLSEIVLQKNYLSNQKVETIYFGGGTPSLLSANEIQTLVSTITEHYEVAEDAEITLEANPDDLYPQKVKELKQTLINRFSIGIQSFYEEDLKWMNRAHNSSEAESSIKRVQDAGFENITTDLIYGYPLLENHKWLNNIQKVIEMKIPHISSYSMTVEPATALASFINKGKQQPMNESQSADQLTMLIETLTGAGFEHYEISNFALPGRYSRHNSNYWKGVSYLGIGPSAHSFNGETRQWNVSNNSKYIESI
ncbi:MAG: hemN 2, partial [Daejeonella sp.]|nr:hemN 2 [Daejeonella sp.]